MNEQLAAPVEREATPGISMFNGQCHWSPAPQIMEWLKQLVPSVDGPKIADIGPGERPFPWANILVGRDIKPEGLPAGRAYELVDVPDFNTRKLPFNDLELDFCFCRHVIEDLDDPAALLGEMARVAKTLYVESPSPIAELARGVDWPRRDQIDGNAFKAKYRGYAHHRWIFWPNGGAVNYVAKWPIAEFYDLGMEQGRINELLDKGPLYWNCYWLWTPSQTSRVFNRLRHEREYTVLGNYRDILAASIDQYLDHTDAFLENCGIPAPSRMSTAEETTEKRK